MSDNTETGGRGRGAKQITNLMEVQYKYEIGFISNYSTVQLR
jgi:hypothetical protein